MNINIAYNKELKYTLRVLTISEKMSDKIIFLVLENNYGFKSGGTLLTNKSHWTIIPMFYPEDFGNELDNERSEC